MPYSHSRNDQGKRHDLVSHLRGVASLARRFAAPLGAGEAAYRLGLWHDIGKFNPAFQSYLLASEKGQAPGGAGHPEHKSVSTPIPVRSS